MSGALPPESILIQFAFMCMHDIIGYFRRIDGRPLDVSTMRGPHDQRVAYEPLNLQIIPQVTPQIRPLLRLCPQCRRHRRRQWRATIRRFFHDPEASELVLDRLRRLYYSLDTMLMDRALGNDIRRVQERIEKTADCGNSSSQQQRPQGFQRSQRVQRSQWPPRPKR